MNANAQNANYIYAIFVALAQKQAFTMAYVVLKEKLQWHR